MKSLMGSRAALALCLDIDCRHGPRNKDHGTGYQYPGQVIGMVHERA